MLALALEVFFAYHLGKEPKDTPILFLAFAVPCVVVVSLIVGGAVLVAISNYQGTPLDPARTVVQSIAGFPYHTIITACFTAYFRRRANGKKSPPT